MDIRSAVGQADRVSVLLRTTGVNAALLHMRKREHHHVIVLVCTEGPSNASLLYGRSLGMLRTR